jgi:hypothetical protein
MWCMSAADEERWLREAVIPDFGEPAADDREWRSWFHDTFLRFGPISGRQLWDLAIEAQRIAAADGCQRVAVDITRTTARAVFITAVEDDYSLRIACDGQHSNHDSGGFFAISAEEAAVEVASVAQDILMEEWSEVWPSCPQHSDAGLHPEWESGLAQWSCHRHGHIVAGIGALGG